MLKLNENKIQVSWWDMSDLIKDLAEKIPFEVPLADSIYGIPRGGLIPAVILSHKLGLPMVDVIGRNTLVVDDMSDSGVTLSKMPGQFTAVLFHKPHTSCFTPNVWSRLHKGNEWLVFPWEELDAPAKQNYLQDDKKELDHLKDAYYIAGMSNDKKGSFMKFMNKLDKK